MCDEREWQRRQCGTKRRYRSHKKAMEVALRLERKDGDAMSAYRCRFCGWWHIGHDRYRKVRDHR